MTNPLIDNDFDEDDYDNTTTTENEDEHYNPNPIVSFGEVTIIEFPIVMGTNPGCSSGCPIEMAWIPKSKNKSSISIDLVMYEYLRNNTSGTDSSSTGGSKSKQQQQQQQQRGRKKRKKKDLVLDVTTRAKLLMVAGYTLDEIGMGTMAVEVIQKQRRDTLQKSGWSKIGTILETTGRLPKGIFTISTDILSSTGGFLLSGVSKLLITTGGTSSTTTTSGTATANANGMTTTTANTINDNTTTTAPMNQRTVQARSA